MSKSNSQARPAPEMDSRNNNVSRHSDWGSEKNKLGGATSPAAAKPKVNYLPAGFSDSDSDGGFEYQYTSSVPKPDPKPVHKLPVASSTASNSTSSTSYPKTTYKTKLQSLPSIPYVNEELAHGISSELNSLWNGLVAQERDASVSSLLRNSFKDCVNPYSMGLYLGLHSCDFRLGKMNGLAHSVFKILKQWLVERGLDELERQFLCPQLQIVSFKVITAQCNTALLRFVAAIYRLDLIRNQLVVHIKDLASEGNFRDACISATILRLYKSFTIHEFLIPLIFQERMSDVEEFMIGSEEIQKSVLTYLDDLLLKENMSEYLKNYVVEHNISQVNKSRFEVRAMSKLIQKLSEKFKISQNSCPNSSRRRKTGNLRHLLSRRYGESSFMNDTDFEDLIDEITADDAALQDETVFLLRIYGDVQAAAKFAIRKALPFRNIPDDVQQEMRRLNPNVCPTEAEGKTVALEEEDWDAVSVVSLSPSPKTPSGAQSPQQPQKKTNSKLAATKEDKVQTPKAPSASAPTATLEKPGEGSSRALERSRAARKFYSISLPLNQIHIVENPQGVNLFLKYISAGQANIEKSAKKELFTVGFDAEWKPMNPGVEGVALIQVATSEDVFLIDCIKLKDESTPVRTEIWKSLMKEFFANDKIIKLGYGISQDYKQLSATTTHWKNMGLHFKQTVDLQGLSKELQGLSDKFFPNQTEAPSEFKGLAELVRLCTGLGLDKSEQWSNWEKRPLRDTQFIYAATDALCLLDIFDFMKVRSQENGIDFDKIVRNHTKGVQPVVKPKKAKKVSDVDFLKNLTSVAPHNSNSPSPFKAVQSVGSVKIIVDSMISGLGKQLRGCGIDTLILDDKESHIKCASYALSEDRYIVTQGEIYNQLATYLPPGHCFQVQSTSVTTQLKDVLGHFNIVVNDTDIYTRCQRCNCNTFINVKGSSMKNVVVSSSVRPDFENPEPGLSGGGLQMWSGALREDMIPSANPEKKALKAWKLLPESALSRPIPSVVKTKSGATVELQTVPVSLLPSIDDFYICNDCGKCYWEGANLERLLTIASISEDNIVDLDRGT